MCLSFIQVCFNSAYICHSLDTNHSIDTNTVMKTLFIFGTQCAVAMLATGERKLAATKQNCVPAYGVLVRSTRRSGLRGGAKFRALYQKLLMGKIGIFTTVYWYLSYDTNTVMKIPILPVRSIWHRALNLAPRPSTRSDA